MSNKELVIYGCGGTGVNLVGPGGIVGEESYYANTSYVTVDTSTSNDRHLGEGVHAYRIPGQEGAGKKQSIALGATHPHVRDLLDKHKPGDLNIVVCSLSGGSGCVIGALLHAELVARNANSILIGIISKDSKVEVANSLKTLSTLQGLQVKKVKRPMVIQTFDNSVTGQLQVNEYVHRTIIGLARLFSGTNDGLDITDLHNWLFYDNVAKQIPPQLVDMAINRHGDKFDSSAVKAISVASLLQDHESTPLDANQLYNTYGYSDLKAVKVEAGDKTVDIGDMHYIITPSIMPLRVQNLQARLEEFEQIEKEVQSATKATTANPFTANADGFAFDD